MDGDEGWEFMFVGKGESVIDYALTDKNERDYKKNGRKNRDGLVKWCRKGGVKVIERKNGR